MLLRVSVGYLELARSSEELAIAIETRVNARQLSDLTQSYADSGQGLRSDADRMEVELALRESDEVRAKEELQVASARLAQLLRLDPRMELTPIDEALVPIDLVSPAAPLGELVVQGISNRPEVCENRHLVEQAVTRMRREQYAVLMPSVLIGGSYGAFGGGINQNISGTGGRFDADAVAYWELRNLGLGDAAARRGTRSQVQQANSNQLATLDLVAREVFEAHAQVSARRIQIEKSRRAVEAALASHVRNLERVDHGQGLPIEALQSVQALAAARREYLRALIDYNTAQFSLYRAIGWPTKLPKAGDQEKC
jgi:outer membrane protein TolC